MSLRRKPNTEIRVGTALWPASSRQRTLNCGLRRRAKVQPAGSRSPARLQGNG